MSIDNQIEIPQSFISLFVRPGRARPCASYEAILERYEQCEDIAATLVEHAQVQAVTAGLGEQDILLRCHRGLLADVTGFSVGESRWIVFRLAELLEWQAPVIDAGEPGAALPPPA